MARVGEQAGITGKTTQAHAIFGSKRRETGCMPGCGWSVEGPEREWGGEGEDRDAFGHATASDGPHRRRGKMRKPQTRAPWLADTTKAKKLDRETGAFKPCMPFPRMNLVISLVGGGKQEEPFVFEARHQYSTIRSLTHTKNQEPTTHHTTPHPHRESTLSENLRSKTRK